MVQSDKTNSYTVNQILGSNPNSVICTTIDNISVAIITVMWYKKNTHHLAKEKRKEKKLWQEFQW